MAKMFEDAFRALEILKDDDPKHVARSIIEVVISPREKKQKGTPLPRPKENAEDKDWLEVTINSYNN